MPEADAWTIGRLLTWTTDYLKQHGSDSARLDAEVLLSFAKKCKRIELYTSFDQPAEEELRTRFRELVKRRSGGTPVAYLVGQREFYSLPFAVSPAVLIPRPETELLVIRVLDLIKERKLPCGEAPAEVVDIGTGSGAIAVAVAKHSSARLTAVDVSAEALAVAAENVARHGIGERTELVQSDLFASLPVERRWDCIVSNPPYIPTADIAGLDKDVRDHEPRGALDGGADGLDVIRRLIDEAAERLKPGGTLLFEIGINERNAALALLDVAVWEASAAIKDSAGIARVIECRRRQPLVTIPPE